MEKSLEYRTTHRTFVDFSSDDNEIFTGPNQTTVEKKDEPVNQQPSTSTTLTEDKDKKVKQKLNLSKRHQTNQVQHLKMNC